MTDREFDVEKLRSAARDLLRVAEALDDQIFAFQDETGAIGEPCGDAEPVGMLLGGSYLAGEDEVVLALDSVVEGFEIFAEDLRTLADRNAEAEQANTRVINALEL